MICEPGATAGRSGWRYPERLTPADFQAMAALEAACYDERYITPAAEAYAWYCREPRSTVVAVDGAALAGFVNLLPVRGEVYAALLAGTYDDSGMTAADLAPAPEGAGLPQVYLFLSCIVVDAAYRGTGLSFALLRRAAAQYARCRVARVVTDNVTAAGERLSDRCGLAFVCDSDHGSRVHAGDWATFCAAIGLC